jgi:coenzyme Q-binding protein COQ10
MNHHEQKTMPYTPAQMFALVMDIERYPEFLPWCVGARVWGREGNHLMADMMVGYKMFREKFTSRVYFVQDQRVQVEYLDGPLRHLRNEWIFTPHGDGHCTVDFRLEFEFRSRLLQGILEKFFNEALKRMTAAFETRAQRLYDPKNPH